MVTPDHFRVDYAINAYMMDSSGNLQNIDSARAVRQWTDLKNVFGSLGLSVEVLSGEVDFPDMVFCANQTLPFLDRQERPHILLSRMHAEQRKGEVRFFRQWAENASLKTFSITDFDFEGAGDAIWNYEKRELVGGYGFRTDVKVYDQLEEIIGVKVHRLKLINPHFYHLDTCLAILGREGVAYVREAFDSTGLELLAKLFPKRIEINVEEARRHFAGNCLCVDGKHVILQKGSPRFVKDLRTAGFTPVEVDVSEFAKSGGSVFCMKQILF
jgi:N-dimethylarginine dimethylaminohydrolase